MKDILVGAQRLSVVHLCLLVLGAAVLCALSLLPDEYVSNPSPTMLLSLLAFLPGVWRLTRSIVSRSSLRKDAIGIVPGLALALWILSTHIFGLLFQNFYLGIAVGTSLLGLLGYITAGKREAFRARPFAYPATLWWSAVAGTLLLLPAVVLKDNWDKLGIITGHFSITEQIVNGIYPPRHLTFADVVLPYHYGVDTLFAMVRVVFRLRFDVAVDLVTTVLFFYTVLLYGHIGVRLFGKKAGPFAGFLGIFSGGFPPAFGFGDMPEPLVSNWFQHPWTLGIPMFLLLFLILTNIETEKRASLPSLAAIAAVTAVLGMAQTALYGIFVASVLAWAGLIWLNVMVRSMTQRESVTRPHYLIDVACAVAAGVFVSFFITKTSSLILSAVSESVVPRNGPVGGSWPQMILWNLQVFSVPLLFGIMGMLQAKKMYIPALMMVCGSLFVFNRYTYLYSWDIVKFTQVVWLPLSIFAGGYLGWLFMHVRYYWRAAILLPSLCLVVFNMAYLWHWNIEGLQAWKTGQNVGSHTALWMEFPRKNIPGDFINAIAWVRQNVRSGEMTLLPSEERTFDAAVLAGLPVLLPGWGDHSLGFTEEEIDRRTQMLENIRTDLHRDYTNEGVRWIVFSPESDIGSQVNEWVAQGVIARAAAFDDTVVYEFTAERE